MLLKKIFDIILALLLLIVSLPLIIIFAIILYVELKSFPIFMQRRGLTLDKPIFKIFKLRTIKPRDKNIAHLTEEDIFLKPGLKEKVTPFAKWLRKTGLDEIPQLLNVVLGQMRLIGPRPLMIEDLETMKRIAPEMHERRNKLTSPPGLSGLWQLFGNRSEGLIGMIALESLYEKVASPLLDLKLILYTSTVIIQAKNSDSIFYVEKSNPRRVNTFIDSSSNLKVTLNMPDGIAKFIVENVEKYEGKYTVKIPQDWWYVSDSYESIQKSKLKSKDLTVYKKSKKTGS